MTKILVVDDSSFARLQIKNILRENGFYQLIEAADGEEALKMYKEYNPDIVTMDILMPECDGICGIAKIRDYDPDAKIIVCTDLAQNYMVIQSIKAGAKNFITKPINSAALMNAIQSILNDANISIVENVEETVPRALSIDKNLIGNSKNCVSITLLDNSLIDNGFYRDDLMIIDKSLPLENGDLAVATYENNFVFGYAYKLTSGKIIMEFANKDYKPINIDPDKLLGVVVTSIRRMKAPKLINYEQKITNPV